MLHSLPQQHPANVLRIDCVPGAPFLERLGYNSEKLPQYLHSLQTIFQSTEGATWPETPPQNHADKDTEFELVFDAELHFVEIKIAWLTTTASSSPDLAIVLTRSPQPYHHTRYPKETFAVVPEVREAWPHILE